MDKTKKIMLVVFATLLMMNLQFNTPLTKGMDNGFSLSQLVENVFVQESYAEGANYCGFMGLCPGGLIDCHWSSNGHECTKP